MITQQTHYKFIFLEGDFSDFHKVEIKKGIVSANELLKKGLSSGNFEFSLDNDNTILIKEEIINADQQERKITGTVVDQSGQPIPGVNISVENTKKGTLRNFLAFNFLNIISKFTGIPFNS